MKHTLLAVTLALLLALSPLTVAAADDPRFETFVPEPTLEPGQTTQLTVQLQNNAEDPDDSVDTAYDVHAEMVAGDTPFTVQSGVRLLGTMRDGQLVSSSFTLTVPQDVEAGTYRIPIRLTYQPAGENERTSTTVYATVRVRDYARFVVVNSSTDAQVGDTGTVRLRLRNTGSANATDASVSLQSGSPDITFGGTPTASRYVGQVGVNETVTVEYRAAISPDADTRPYSLTASVTYDDEDGVQRNSPPMTLGVTPVDEQAFSLSDVQSTLRVGEEGTLTATVTNDGPGSVDDVVVRLAQPSMNVEPLETQYAVGTLAADESATVEFPVEVTSSAEPGPKQFTLRVEYQNQAGDTRESDGLNARVDVTEERDRFQLDPVSTTLTAGSSGELVLAVTNNGDDPVRNVNAKLFTDDPISASDDEAFLTELAPGDTAEITFGIASSGGALEKAYPVDLDFQYDVDGDTELSKTYTVAIDVTEPTDSGGLPTTYLVVGGVVLLAVGGYLLYRQR